MNETLVAWLWEHPKEAKGINITMTGADVITLFHEALKWCKMEYKNMQQPLRLTTEEVCRTYHVCQKTLYNLSTPRTLKNGEKVEAQLHPEFVSGKNLYKVEELEKVLAKTSPSRAERKGNLSKYNSKSNDIQQ